MRIAILGWGSLVWDLGDLRVVDDTWHKGGPELQIELSRVSQKRGYLTYVIDETHTRRVPTRYAVSRFRSMEDAIANLACREGCAAHSIGYVKSGPRARRRSRTGLWMDIQVWVRAKKFDAAIWTDLPPDFPGGFTLDRAVAFFKRLPVETAEDARKYVREAPQEVDTDLRRRLHAENLLAPAPAAVES